MSQVHVETTNKEWSTVHLTGAFSRDEVSHTAKTYQELFNHGVRKLLIDARKTSSEMSSLIHAQPELHQALGKFDKIVLLVEDAKNAFSLKALANKNPKAKVTYSADEAHEWLRNP